MATLQEKREFWRRHVQQWRASGLSQATYCTQHDLHPKSLSRWSTRLPDAATPVTLVPAVRPPTPEPLVLHTGRWQLELPAGTSAAWLADLLGQLP